MLDTAQNAAGPIDAPMTRLSLEEYETQDASFRKMLSRQARELADLGFTVVAIVIEPTVKTSFKWGWAGQGEAIVTMHKILLLTNSPYGNPRASFVTRHTIRDRLSNDPRDQHFVGPEECAECWPTDPLFASLIKHREGLRREARSIEKEKKSAAAV